MSKIPSLFLREVVGGLTDYSGLDAAMSELNVLRVSEKWKRRQEGHE